jgi:gluconolactonase
VTSVLRPEGREYSGRPAIRGVVGRDQGGLVKASVLLGVVILFCAATVGAQPAAAAALHQGHGVRAADDAREAAVLATCKRPPAPPAAPAAGAGAPVATPAPHEYTVAGIPGVIAAGQRWKQLWSESGLDPKTLTFFIADGIIAAGDGGILIPQAEKSDVIELMLNRKVRVVYQGTQTGGALSQNKKGVLFIAQRELNPAIWELAPKRKLLANRYQDEPLDCLGVGLNDLAANSKGGVYFTMGGLYYADPHGTITKYGDNLRTNGIVLSPDEKILYVTNGASLVGFDVQPDGSLIHQRELAMLPDGSGDGCTIDEDGRIYVTGGGAGVRVVAPDGRYLGTIATPLGVQSVTFGGPDKKTLFALMNGASADRTGAQIIAISMLAKGYKSRAK